VVNLARKAARPLLGVGRWATSLIGRLRFRSAIERFLYVHSHVQEPQSPVLVWELGNFPGIVARNGLFATALKVRGRRTHTILCDGTPVACIRRGIEQPEALEDWANRCSACANDAHAVARKYCLDLSWVGDYVSVAKRREFLGLSESLPLRDVLEHVHLGACVGRIAWSSLNRHLKGTLMDEATLTTEQERILRMYLYAALVNVHAANEATAAIAPASVLTSHGVYVDYAPAMSIAYQKRLSAVSWSSAYADGYHYFTVPKGANQLLLQGVSNDELWKQRAAAPLSAAEEERLEGFLHHRYFRAGARDINVISAPEDRETLRRRIGLRPGKPVFCVFPHVNWDACFDMSSMIYPTANDWTLQTIRHLIGNTRADWIIRIHPGELTDGSVLSTGDIIKAEFPALPDHVKVLWADSDINSYGLYQLIDGGVTIFGTVGVELAAMGKPVILAGQAHYGGKGFTIDAGSPTEYCEILDRVASIAPLSADQTALARRYAYWYFVQRQIPIRAIDRTQGHWGDLDTDRLDSLLPGRDPIMDIVCRNIVEGRDFILPSNAIPQSHA
jgi:capsular polysaccharide biosynthesis protein